MYGQDNQKLEAVCWETCESSNILNLVHAE
jgi:hypothetical protein